MTKTRIGVVIVALLAGIAGAVIGVAAAGTLGWFRGPAGPPGTAGTPGHDGVDVTARQLRGAFVFSFPADGPCPAGTTAMDPIGNVALPSKMPADTGYDRLIRYRLCMISG